MSKTVIIRDLEIHYANLQRPHEPFGDPIWDMQIRTTDPKTIEQLKEVGVNMKQHADGYAHANVKRRVMNRKGEKNTPVVVVDKNKQPIGEDVRIGHGSKGHIKLFSYEWSQMGKSGTSAMLSAVQITDLIEYTGGDAVDFDVEDASDF